MKKEFIYCFSLSIFLSGCASSVTKTTSPNGLPAYIIDCSYEWCYSEIAGSLCGNKGYNIINGGLVECKQ